MGAVRAHAQQRNRGLERSVRFIATDSPGALIRTGDRDNHWPTGEADSIRISNSHSRERSLHLTKSWRTSVLARLRHADRIERCPLSGVTWRTSAQSEFFRL